MRIWQNSRGITGFEVKFEVPDTVEGFPPMIKKFGSSIDVSQYERVQINQEITGDYIFKGDGKVLRKIEFVFDDDLK